MTRNFPESMRQLNQWVCYQLPSKIPINPNSGSPAKAGDSSTWGSFESACLLADQRGLGIGFEFCAEDPFVGIDFDHCLDESGAFLDESVRAFVMILWKSGTYVEISQSGNGLHVIVENSIPAEFLGGNVGGRKFGSFCEMYQSSRYFALTGNLFHSRSKSPRIKKIENRTWIKCLKILQSGSYSEFKDLADRKTVNPVEEYQKSNPRFSSAISGDLTPWDGDESDRDFYLLSRLFELLGDEDQVRSVWLSSPAGDVTRKVHHEDDYVTRSIRNAKSQWELQGSRRRSGSGGFSKKTREIKDSSNVVSPPRVDISADSYDCTDLSNGRKLLSICCKEVRYCYESDQFYRWRFNTSDPVWISLPPVALYDFCAYLSDDLKSQAESVEDESLKKKYYSGARMMKMNTSCDRAISRLKSFPEIHIPIDVLDSSKFVIPCLNGYLNLETGEISDPNPYDFFTHCLDVFHDPSARCDRWIEFVEEVLPDPAVRSEVQKFMGYCLTGDTSLEKFLYIYGSGGNGKGTFLNACMSVLGSFASTFPMSLIAVNRFKDGESASPVLASLRSVRLAVSDEISPNVSVDVAVLKSLTGGDRIVARQLRKDPIEYVPQFKLILVGNEKIPLGSSNDRGLDRRFMYVEFGVTPQRLDPSLKRYLSSSECRSGILNWMLDGYLKLQSEGFVEVASMSEGKDVLMSLDDQVSSFIAEYCVVAEDLSVRVSVFMTLFFELTKSKQSRASIIQQVLSDTRIKLIRPGNVQTFKGVGIREVSRMEG